MEHFYSEAFRLFLGEEVVGKSEVEFVVGILGSGGGVYGNCGEDKFR